MPYLQVNDFKFGMDRRRKRVAGTPGTLWLGKNVHITRGGDIERRLKFVPVYNVAGSFSAGSLHSQPYTFGSAALTMPVGVQYQRLQAPSGAAMTKLLDVKTFSGKFYAIAEYADGTVHHFYDGARVSNWDTVVATAGADFTTLADLLAAKIETDAAVTATSVGSLVTISALVPGTAFSISAATVNGGAGVNDQTAVVTTIQANVAEVDEVRASASTTVNGGTLDAGVNQIAAVTIDAVDVLGKAIDWSGSNESTALRVAQQITSGFTTHGYSASVVGATVTVKAAPGTGATPNGFDFLVTAIGNVSVSSSSQMAGGVTAVTAVAQVCTVAFGGTFEAADTFTVTINGTDYKATGGASGMGRTAYVDKNRVWTPIGSLWRYCKLNDPTVWDPLAVSSDAGFINIATATEGNERLLVAARYQGLAGVFSSENITLYQLDQDPANFAFSDTLEHTGTKAPFSVLRYGNNDVFYLDITGVRSLRARDASNAPFVSDIGNAIDSYVQELVKALSKQEVADARAAIEPRDGRYWLILGDEIIVLSFFPGAKVSAWTTYEPTEFAGAPVQAFIRVGGQLVARAGNFLYYYGGATGDVQPGDGEVIAEVHCPFLSGQTPATIKYLRGFDVALTNTWACEIAFDPNDDTRTINVGNLSQITFADPGRIPVPGQTSMVAPILTCSKGGAASISMLAIHYEGEEDPG